MPPADPAAILAAVATVRELGFGDVGFDIPTLCRWTDAVVLLAREFVRLLDAGELVREVPCTAIGPHHGDRCSGGRTQSPNAQFTRDCESCRGTGFVMEPLIAKEVGR